MRSGRAVGKGAGKHGGTTAGNRGYQDPYPQREGTVPNSWHRKSNGRDYDPQYSWRGGWQYREPKHPSRGHQGRGGRPDRPGYRPTPRERDDEEFERYRADRDRERAESRARRGNPY